MKASVDVFVPCYKYAHYLDDCVQSILSQANVDVRVLILDDASPDHTPQVGNALAASDPRVTYRRHAVNRGHIATFNEGIDWARGRYCLLLSADDYLTTGALERAATLMDSNPELGFVFGNALALHEDGSLERIIPFGADDTPARRIFSGQSFIRASGPSNIVPSPTAVVRTSLQKQAGGYRPELPHAGDMEMWLRLAALSGVGFITADQAVYRRHRTNMSLDYLTASTLPDLEQRLRALQVFFEQSGSDLSRDAELRHFLVKGLAEDAIRHAGMAFNAGNLDAADAIKRFAVKVSPHVSGSWPWTKLRVKQALGNKTWRALNSFRGHR